MSIEKAKEHILTITLDIVDETGQKWGFLAERLRVENIPGAWRLTRLDPQSRETVCPEMPGIGVSRFDAVMDWLVRNHSQGRFANLANATDLRRKVAQALQSLSDLQIEMEYRDLGNS